MNSSKPGFAPSTSSDTLQHAPASARQVLRALFEFALADRPADAGSVARRLGLRASEVAQHLIRLDALGLARAERARLTLVGLATAARLEALPVVRARECAAEQGAEQERRAPEARPEHHDVPVAQRLVAAPDGTDRFDSEFRSRAEPPASTERTIRTGSSSVSL